MKIKYGKTTLAAVFTLLLAGILFVSVPLAAFGEEEVPVVRQKPRDDYHLGAGDLVQVIIWKNEDVSGEFRVRPDGKFSMPLIGDILAEGSNADSISVQIEQKLKLFIESPYVSTIVVEAASNRIYVLGEVVNTGTYAIDGSLTVLQALALAGGFTEFASKEKMVLVRGVGVVQINTKLSYSKILRTPGEETNPIMERGDTLVVP